LFLTAHFLNNALFFLVSFNKKTPLFSAAIWIPISCHIRFTDIADTFGSRNTTASPVKTTSTAQDTIQEVCEFHLEDFRVTEKNFPRQKYIQTNNYIVISTKLQGKINPNPPKRQLSPLRKTS
jgi:hypothetical protein